MNYILYNNQIVSESKIHLGVSNRGFLYGDGIFETMIIKNNTLRNYTDHIERFRSGLKAIHLTKIFIDYNTLLNNIFELKTKNGIDGDARIKLIAWRKPGGLFTAEFEDGDYIVTIQKHSEVSNIKEKVIFSSDIKKVYTSISSYKTLSSLPYIIAGYEKKQKGADDIIILDTTEYISETLVANIFWIKGDALYTPSLETGCIKGIMRKQVMTSASAMGLKTYEGKYIKEELLSADFIFTSNAAGLDLFANIDGKEFNRTSEVFDKISKEVL